MIYYLLLIVLLLILSPYICPYFIVNGLPSPLVNGLPSPLVNGLPSPLVNGLPSPLSYLYNPPKINDTYQLNNQELLQTNLFPFLYNKLPKSPSSEHFNFNSKSNENIQGKYFVRPNDFVLSKANPYDFKSSNNQHDYYSKYLDLESHYYKKEHKHGYGYDRTPEQNQFNLFKIPSLEAEPEKTKKILPNNTKADYDFSLTIDLIIQEISKLKPSDVKDFPILDLSNREIEQILLKLNSDNLTKLLINLPKEDIKEISEKISPQKFNRILSVIPEVEKEKIYNSINPSR